MEDFQVGIFFNDLISRALCTSQNSHMLGKKEEPFFNSNNK